MVFCTAFLYTFIRLWFVLFANSTLSCFSDVYFKPQVSFRLTSDECETDNRVCVYSRLSTSTAYATVNHRFRLSKLLILKPFCKWLQQNKCLTIYTPQWDISFVRSYSTSFCSCSRLLYIFMCKFY